MMRFTSYPTYPNIVNTTSAYAKCAATPFLNMKFVAVSRKINSQKPESYHEIKVRPCGQVYIQNGENTPIIVTDLASY